MIRDLGVMNMSIWEQVGGSGFDVWQRAGLRAQAEVSIPKLDFETVSQWPLPKIREVADKQIKLTKESFEMASEVAWYEGLYVRYKNHKRWGPYLDKIKAAEKALKEGDAAQTEPEKRKLFLEAWSVSRLASEEIHKEGNMGPTTYATVAVELGKSVKESAQPLIKGAQELSDNVASAIKWGVGLGLALLLLNQTRK